MAAQEGNRPTDLPDSEFLDALPQGVMIVDKSGRYLAVNLAASQILRSDRAALLNSSFHEIRIRLIAPDGSQVKAEDPPGEMTLKTGVSVHQRVWGWLTDDGDTIWIEWSADPYPRDGVLLNFYDVTQRVKTEISLRQQRENANRYLDISGVIILALNPEGRITLLNQQGYSILGYAEGELSGVDWCRDCLPAEDYLVLHAAFEQLISGELEPVQFYENYILRKDGGKRLISWFNSLQIDDQGKTIGTLSFGRDITEERNAQLEVVHLSVKLEQRVRERTAQLEAANEELEAFSYSVAHDLHAYVRRIHGFSQILLEDYSNMVDEEGRHFISRIHRAAKWMEILIDDLLKLSKTNRIELKVSECDLSILSSRVAGHLADLNPQRKVEIFIQPGMLVLADPNLLQVMLENLLGNAWKFTSRCQDPKVEVGETVSSRGERTFFVRDNGAGFDMASAGKLFTAFQRLHSSTDFEGTGIGLAIVQRIIHRHGGRAWAEAEPGKGATFFFTLPDSGLGTP